MPPRVIVAGILAFWLVVTGFAFYRDVWPRLFAAIRGLRPKVVLEDWTHTLRGRFPTRAEPGAAPDSSE